MSDKTDYENDACQINKSTSTQGSSSIANDSDVDSDECENDGSDDWMEKLQSFFATKLNLEKKDIPQVLDSVDVDGVIKYIKNGKCKNVITMAGAGISTSAGIPDFRSPETGLYSNLEKYNLPCPEAVFDIEYFKTNPKPFFELAKELYPGDFRPTTSHHFIKLLHDKGFLLRHYTQNVDNLEHKAGIPVEKLVEAHGTFRTSHCLQCKKSHDQSWMKDEIFKDKIPSCVACGGVVKPDIVFFREGLPSRFFDLMSTDFKKCELLIIMGTSLTVQPFASLSDNVESWCPRLLINREKVEVSNLLMAAIGGGACSEQDGGKRDVEILDDCDAACLSLAEKLGWKDELQTLIEKASQT